MHAVMHTCIGCCRSAQATANYQQAGSSYTCRVQQCQTNNLPTAHAQAACGSRTVNIHRETHTRGGGRGGGRCMGHACTSHIHTKTHNTTHTLTQPCYGPAVAACYGYQLVRSGHILYVLLVLLHCTQQHLHMEPQLLQCMPHRYCHHIAQTANTLG